MSLAEKGLRINSIKNSKLIKKLSSKGRLRFEGVYLSFLSGVEAILKDELKAGQVSKLIKEFESTIKRL